MAVIYQYVCASFLDFRLESFRFSSLIWAPVDIVGELVVIVVI